MKTGANQCWLRWFADQQGRTLRGQNYHSNLHAAANELDRLYAEIRGLETKVEKLQRDIRILMGAPRPGDIDPAAARRIVKEGLLNGAPENETRTEDV